MQNHNDNMADSIDRVTPDVFNNLCNYGNNLDSIEKELTHRFLFRNKIYAVQMFNIN